MCILTFMLYYVYIYYVRYIIVTHNMYYVYTSICNLSFMSLMKDLFKNKEIIIVIVKNDFHESPQNTYVCVGLHACSFYRSLGYISACFVYLFA